MTQIHEQIKANPKLLQRILETAVDSAWGYIECASLPVLDGEVEWMDLGIDKVGVVDDLQLLIDLGLACTHHDHPEWVREIATL